MRLDRIERLDGSFYRRDKGNLIGSGIRLYSNISLLYHAVEMIIIKKKLQLNKTTCTFQSLSLSCSGRMFELSQTITRELFSTYHFNCLRLRYFVIVTSFASCFCVCVCVYVHVSVSTSASASVFVFIFCSFKRIQ